MGHRVGLKSFGEATNFLLRGFEPQTIQSVASCCIADRNPRKRIEHFIEQYPENSEIGNMHFYVERHWTGHALEA